VSNDVLQHTKGLGFLNNKNNTVFIDSVGIDPRFKKNIRDNKYAKFIQQWKAKDFFVQSYILNHANILIIMFNTLSPDDQKLYNVLLEKCKMQNQILIMIHNFKETYSVDTIEYKLSSFLEPGFNLQKKEFVFPNRKDKIPHTYYEQNFGNNRRIMHLVLGREGSDAGNHYNPFTINFLNHLIMSQTAKEEFDPLSSFFKFAKLNLRNYVDVIYAEDKNDEFPLEMDKDKIYSKYEFTLTNFLLESFGNVIQDLEQNDTVLDYIISKEESCLEAFFFIPKLREDSLKLTVTQKHISHYSMRLEGRRSVPKSTTSSKRSSITSIPASLNNVDSPRNQPNQPNSESKDKYNIEDFQIVVGVDVNHKYEINKNAIQMTYKNSVLMMRIPKIEERNLTFSSSFVS